VAGSGLSALLEPASIAIVGASSRHGHFGNQALVNLRTFGFRGRVYAVNPRRSEIEGVACFPTIADLPEAVDHAVIVLPADRAPGAVLQCGARGIPTATVVASGFAETGDEAGVALQANLASAIAETGVRVCGPNTLGTANFVTGAVPFVSGNLPDEPPGRGVAIVSQSGGIGFTILNRAFSRGAGCGHLVVAGNELDIAIPELVEALLGAEGVRALAVYIEAVRDPEGLLTAARRALEADIPVVVLKAGRSAAGARAAAAHTGALASSGAVFDGVLRQAGCVIASSLDELIGAAALFGRHGRARGTRLGVYGMGGGLSVLMADLVDGAGLELPAPAPETRDRLKAILPDTTPGNPFDSGGQFLTARGEPLLPGALTAFAADDAFDAMVYACMPVLKTRERIYGEAIVAAAAAIDKPQVALHYGAPPLTAGMTDLLRRAGLVVLDPPEAGVRALQRWATWRPDEVEAAPPPPPIAPLAALVRLRDLRAAGRAVVTEHVAAGLLEDAGVPVARARVAHSPEEAIALAAVLAGPDGVAMKALSAQVTHRARAGALVLGVTEGAAAAAYRRIVERVAAIPGAILEGVLVQEMLPPGPELMAGLKMDPQFGPVVLAGLGGVLVERLGRVAIRRGPVGATGALAMLREVGLEDAGALAGGLAAILDALAALAAGAGGLLSEIDCNPLLVDADGRLRAADALITLA
jgi:acyl-CoA synthetase (NDP forming)